MRSVLEPSLSGILASMSVPGSTLMGAQSNFPSVFDTATHNPASKNPGSKASVQNTHFNSNPGTPTPTKKSSNGAYSSMGNASAVSKATEESVMNTSSTLDEQPPATSAPRRGRQRRDSNRAEFDADFDDEKTLETAGHTTINASNPAFSYSQGPGSTRSMPVADSSSVGVPAQRQPLPQAGAVDSSFLGAGHQTMDESSFAGVPTESVSVLHANYDSDSEFGGDTTTILSQLQVQQQRHMHEPSEASHFDVGSDSDTEHDESISIPPPRGAPTQVDEFVACVGNLAPPPRTAEPGSPGGRAHPPPDTSAGFTTTTVTAASSQISSHQLHQLPVQNRSARADRTNALMQPNAVHYGDGTESSVIATTEQSTSSHPVQYSCDNSSAVSNICPGGRGVAARRAHVHARMHGGGAALASDDDDDDLGEDEESETSFTSTDLDMSTAQMHDSDLRSRVYGAVSSIASQSQATTPGTAGGPRHRHVFQRPVQDGSTLLTPTQMAKYYNCGETGVTEYNHSAVIAALQGALEDGVVSPEDIMPVHNFLAPIKTNGDQLRAAQEHLSQLPYMHAQPSSSALTSPSLPSVRNPMAPSMSLPGAPPSDSGSSKFTVTPSHTPLNSEPPNTFFSDVSTTPGQGAAVKASSYATVSTDPSRLSSKSSKSSIPRPGKHPKGPKKGFGLSSQISPSSNLSRLSGSRKGGYPGTPSAGGWPSSLPDIQEDDEPGEMTAHGNPFFQAKFASNATHAESSLASSAAPKESLSRGLFYQPPTSSLASGRSLSIAATQATTWKTQNELKSSSSMSGSSAPLKPERSGLSRQLSISLSRPLSRTSGQQEQVAAAGSTKTAGNTKAVAKKIPKVPVKTMVGMVGMSGIMRCAGCAAPVSAMGASTMGASTMGP